MYDLVTWLLKSIILHFVEGKENGTVVNHYIWKTIKYRKKLRKPIKYTTAIDNTQQAIGVRIEVLQKRENLPFTSF